MAEDEDRGARRGVAVCTNCESVHSVRIWEDGSIRPIGTGYGTECTCGESDFEIVGDSAQPNSDRIESGAETIDDALDSEESSR